MIKMKKYEKKTIYLCFTKPLFHYAYLFSLSANMCWLNNGIKSFSAPGFFHNSLLLSWFAFWFEISCFSTHNFIFNLLHCDLLIDMNFGVLLLAIFFSLSKFAFRFDVANTFCVLLLVICFSLSLFAVPFSLTVSRFNPYFLHLTGFWFRVVMWFPILCSRMIFIRYIDLCFFSQFFLFSLSLSNSLFILTWL